MDLKWQLARLAFRSGDYSYGLYIYASPLQQLIIALLGDSASPLLAGSYTIALTLPFASFGWHCMEKMGVAMAADYQRSLAIYQETNLYWTAMRQWIKTSSLLIGAMATLGGSYFAYEQYLHYQHFAGCTTAGRFDQIVAEQFGTGEGTLVQGWLIAPSGGGALRLDEMTDTFPLQPSEERTDVQHVFPQCAVALASGFSVRLPSDAHGKYLQLLAKTDQGIQVLEQRDYAPPQIRVEFDTMDEIEPNGRNTVSGWAMSSDGTPVKLEFLADGQIVASTEASLLRSDVAAMFPNVNFSAKSGFDVKISFAGLPRGDYPLKLRATVPNSIAPPLVRDGPIVRNRQPYGLALTLKQRTRNPRTLEVFVWLAHESGIKSARLSTGEGKLLGHMAMQQSHASFVSWSHDLISDLTPPIQTGSIWHIKQFNSLPAGIHRLQVNVTTNDGVKATIPAQLIVNELPAAKRRADNAACDRDPLLVFYPTGPGTIAGLGAQREASSLRDLVEGPCVRIGMRLRVEYLRTTLGKANDFVFDPYFQSAVVKVNGRSMTTAGLDEALALADKYGMPVLLSLDGGVWADSAFPAPEWDVVDNLEDDERTVQWNQLNRSEKDDALSSLSGSPNDPQLARMMSLNVYNEKFRAYKKRNLQAAVAHIVAHQKHFSQHAVWINFDSDNYINPWFKNTQWYDYNPDTLRQFREWLTGTGAYANGGVLAGGSLAPVLDLGAINTIAKAKWKSLGDVDPPRGALDANDPWYVLWVQFKRHLVARHYTDLSEWACQAGMPSDQIYTAVGISDGTVPKEFNDPLHGWNDQSGVTLRGGKPGCGHLGVVMYGPATRGESTTRDGQPFMTSVTKVDPAFGVVEFHAANLDLPSRLPSQLESRKSLMTLLDAGMKFVSPMWGSLASGQTLFPAQFHAYEAMEGTAFETELVRALSELNVKHSYVAKP
jgi:hypothetical protein